MRNTKKDRTKKVNDLLDAFKEFVNEEALANDADLEYVSKKDFLIACMKTFAEFIDEE